ncbi:hypothetical protein HELRODRAFT_173607 [Helobdella robusta]|uniref:Uncharacterized protein n=1 Tax=Helobdella robusta TaxID=6412 RepID=T1F713_HELRO|nr:hypothetical protein HELRODRAFT_173607 [Helobdella robusta]ESO03321.1 hypothetical protein HELRODRAFT_173607 [Helobdella robusta]
MCNFEAKTNDEDVNDFLKMWNEMAEKYNWNKNMMKRKSELLVDKLKSFEKTYFSVSACNENEGSKTAATSEFVPTPIEVDVFPSNENDEETKIIVKNKNIGMERNHKFKNKKIGSHFKRCNINACKDSSSKKKAIVSENNCLKNTHHKKILKTTLEGNGDKNLINFYKILNYALVTFLNSYEDVDTKDNSNVYENFIQ